MKPSVKGWAVAAQQDNLKEKMHGRDYDPTYTDRRESMAAVYVNKADSKEEKKSVIGELMFFADRELCKG